MWYEGPRRTTRVRRRRGLGAKVRAIKLGPVGVDYRREKVRTMHWGWWPCSCRRKTRNVLESLQRACVQDREIVLLRGRERVKDVTLELLVLRGAVESSVKERVADDPFERVQSSGE